MIDPYFEPHPTCMDPLDGLTLVEMDVIGMKLWTYLVAQILETTLALTRIQESPLREFQWQGIIAATVL